MTDKDNVIILTDDEGNELECDYLDTVNYLDKNYVILYPLDQDENEGDVIIFELVNSDDGSEEYISVDDDALLDEVFAEYMRIVEEEDDEEEED